MSSQEQKKKEKGKEIVTSEENPTTSEVSMYFSEQGIAALLEANKKDNAEKVGTQQKKSSSSKIKPCIFYTSDEKARLRWSSDLHACFVKAVEKLGGPDKATPKAVKDTMEVEGIALHHVKSHLQKFRLGRCNIRDETDQYHKRYRTGRRFFKAHAASNSPRPQVNIRPKVMGDVKPKKAKEDHGSLYMRIEHDLNLQRCREAERMQMAFEIEHNRKMLEAQYLQAGKAPSITSQHRNYISTTTQRPSSQVLDQWLADHYSGRQTSDSQQPTTMIPQTTTCLPMFPLETKTTFSKYDPQHVNTSTQEKRQFNNSLNYNMTQGFINPYVTTEPQSMPGSSTVTTQPELQLNDDCLIHDLYRNPSFLPTSVPQTVDSLHQVISNITSPLSTAPQPIQTYAPNHTYNYPEYNTLERVKAQLSALQYSSTSRIQATPFCETNLSSSVTRDDEEDPVDMYIDWGKYEEVDIDELDPVEALLALGFSVSP
ncbi:uncharacterized protein LOC103828546 isoform X2 [Brassica rapa]|uniref:uncharacterized protein LOC111199430 n=1 Tax=Brassica napus TaxID=3708 RepID=UPI0004F17D8E|nr:uncharacterized protein LOC103828546 isoform X2 [Brassica rapa]XP_022545224.1 uncharacterized protein LOC111199430 [Brassica napus]